MITWFKLLKANQLLIRLFLYAFFKRNSNYYEIVRENKPAF